MYLLPFRGMKDEFHSIQSGLVCRINWKGLVTGRYLIQYCNRTHGNTVLVEDDTFNYVIQ